MKFLSAYHTDIGIKKSTNQDSLLIKVANTSHGKIGIFAICDGMGGLSSGELASSSVIKGLSKWFEEDFPKLLPKENLHEEVEISLKQYIRFANSQICNYGKENDLKLGTTITVMIIINQKYIIAHVGDSRAYNIGESLVRITKDQSFVQREIDLGNITEEQARNHKKKNLLLQCVGVTPTIEILTYRGNIKPGTVYLLCTDGLYHKVTEKELVNNLNGSKFQTESQMKQMSIRLIDLVKQRREIDNISMILVKII